MKIRQRPIGIFDSGLGGLTVVKEIVRQLPHEDIVYLGDTGRLPYGTRSKNTIIKFSLEDANFLIKKKVKCIVIACNTASSFASSALRKNIKIPIFDVISPTAKAAPTYSKNKKIGVIGTRGTVTSGSYERELKKVSHKFKVVSRACPLFVPFIEEGEMGSQAIKMIAKRYLEPLKTAGIDTLIMGCTHYPIIKGILGREMGKPVKLVNPGEFVAVELLEYLTEKNLLNNKKLLGAQTFFVTDMTPNFVKIGQMFLGEKIGENLRKVDLKIEK